MCITTQSTTILSSLALALILTQPTYAAPTTPIKPPKHVPTLSLPIDHLTSNNVGKHVTITGTVFDATCTTSGFVYQLIDRTGGISVSYGGKVYDGIKHVDQFAVGATVQLTGTLIHGKNKLLISVTKPADTVVLTPTQRMVTPYALGGLTGNDYNALMQVEGEIYRIDTLPQGIELIIFDKTGAQRVRILNPVLSHFAKRDLLVPGNNIKVIGRVKMSHSTGLRIDIALPTDLLDVESKIPQH